MDHAGRVLPAGGRELSRIASAEAALPVAATALALGAVAESVVQAARADVGHPYGLVLVGLALCTTAPLGFLRPRAAALTIAAASVLSLAPFRSLTVAGACALLCGVHRLGRRGYQALPAVLSIAFLALALAIPGQGPNRVLSVSVAALVPGAAWAGSASRSRSETRAHHAARQAIDGTLVEHTARGERARIARELHDVVAHHISMVAVQAESARLTVPGMPAAGARQLSAIGDTARAALTEMRRLLGVLREDAETDSADRQPQPGLRQLNDLLDEARTASGTGTRLILRGRPDVLDPGVELAAYRIVQEALTNARRHAPGAAVDVELHYSDDQLRLRIRDNGPGPAASAPGDGHGLMGMRERAAAVGGRLSTGAAPGGGFVVEAVLARKPELVT